LLFKLENRDCIRDAFRKFFGIRALFFALDETQGAPRQSPMCDCSKPLRNPPKANRGFRVKPENRAFFLGTSAAAACRMSFVFTNQLKLENLLTNEAQKLVSRRRRSGGVNRVFHR
jgi:hypothetical protein